MGCERTSDCCDLAGRAEGSHRLLLWSDSSISKGEVELESNMGSSIACAFAPCSVSFMSFRPVVPSTSTARRMKKASSASPSHLRRSVPQPSPEPVFPQRIFGANEAAAFGEPGPDPLARPSSAEAKLHPPPSSRSFRGLRRAALDSTLANIDRSRCSLPRHETSRQSNRLPRPHPERKSAARTGLFWLITLSTGQHAYPP